MTRSRTRGNRAHAPTPRARRVTALFDDTEWAVVVEAAERASLRPGAWVARAAVAESLVATGRRRSDWRGLLALAGELRDLRRLLGNIGGNLNDVARHANTEHTLAPETDRVLAMVRDLAGRTSQQLQVVREQTR